VPNNQGGPAPDIKDSNTIGFYAPALALVVRGTSRIHSKFGGVLGGKSKDKLAGEARLNDLDLGPGKIFLAGGPKNLKVGPSNDEDKIAKLDPKMFSKDPALDPRKIWQEALTNGVNNPGLIIATADFLADCGLFDHAAEFLKANLRQGIVIEPWVYEALAIALELSGGSPEEIRRARLSGIALNPQSSEGFIKAAKAMSDHRMYDRALAFCQQAASLDPNAIQPYLDALQYAQQGKDSKGMEWAAGKLLGQEWVTGSRAVHLKTQSKLEELASALAEDSRHTEAARLRDLLKKARQRDVTIVLTWEDGASGPADLELEVAEPSGSVCNSQHRFTPGGGVFTGNNLGELRRATYVAAEAFSGDYVIKVRRVWGDPMASKARLQIIVHDGTDDKKRNSIVSVDLKKNEPVKFSLTDGRRISMAQVPALPEPTQETKEESRGTRILEKLRAVADPFYTDMPKGIQGSVGGALGVEPRMPVAKAKGPEQLVYQTGISGTPGSGVNLSAQATLSADMREMHLRVQAIFQNSALPVTRPAVNVPAIPGGNP
jgi:tetratricopeptide (TPR) repeat protein